MTQYRRPWFTPHPNTGLTIATGAANGLQKGFEQGMNIQSQIQRMKAMQMQNQARMVQAQGIADWRQAMAEKARRDSMGSSAADIQLLQAMSKGGKIDPSVLKPALKDRVENFLQAAKPEEKVALANHINQQINQGQIPEEVGKSIDFTPKTLDLFGKMQGSQARLQGIGAQEQGKNDRNAQTNQTRETVAAGNNAATVKAAQVRGSDAAGIRTGGKNQDPAIQAEIKGHQTAYSTLQKQIAEADKPGFAGMAPDPADVAKRRTVLQQMANEHLDAIHHLSTAGTQPGPATGNVGQAASAPQAPAAPQVLPADQWQKAQPGQYVATPDGKGYHKALGNGQFDPTPIPQVPAPTPAQAVPAPAGE